MVRQGRRLECWKTHGAVDARPLDLPAVDADRAFFIRQQAGDDVEQRGLAAAAGADDGEKLSVADRDGNIGQCDDFAVERLAPVSLRDVLDPQLGTSVHKSARPIANRPQDAILPHGYFPKASRALRCSSALMEGPNNWSKKPSLTSLLT